MYAFTDELNTLTTAINTNGSVWGTVHDNSSITYRCYDITDAKQEIDELKKEVTMLRSLLYLSSEDLAAIRELKQLKELILELGFEKLLMEGAE